MKHGSIAALLPALVLIALGACMSGCGPRVVYPVTTLPVAKEASLIESVSPAEVMVKASGKGIHPDKRKRLGLAIEDARRTAVWFVLHAPVDPLLQTTTEERKFTMIEPTFYSVENLAKYITWESEIQGVVLSVMQEGITIGKQVSMSFKVNKKLLREDLAAIGIVAAISDLAEEIGTPIIMVLPDTPGGASPFSGLDRPRFKAAAFAAESYLTALRYDVIAPEAAAAVDNQVIAQQMVAGLEDDPSYSLALAMGSDIYLTCSVDVERGQYGTRKASVGMRAYETTTARLLGSETGFSRSRPAAEAVVIEEAARDAVDKVLSRITAYWKEDIDRGIQFKIVGSFAGILDQERVESIQFAFSDILDDACEKKKELIISPSTMDLIVWVDPLEFESASDLYRHIKQKLTAAVPGISVSKLSLNRKLIVIEISER